MIIYFGVCVYVRVCACLCVCFGLCLCVVFLYVTSLPWPYRQMYSCIRQKGGRTSSKSPRR